MLTVLLVALSATDLIVAEIGDFYLTLFWPLFIFSALIWRRGSVTTKVQKSTAILGCLALAMLFSATLMMRSTKATSLMLSLLFLLYSIWIVRQRRYVLPSAAANAFIMVLGVYFASTLLGVLLVAFGEESSLLSLIARSSYDANTNAFRPQGLSSEPSYAATIVCVAWLALARVRTVAPDAVRRLRLWAAASILMLIIFSSMYGLVLGALVASTYFDRRGRQRPRVIAVAFLVAIVVLSYVLSSPDSRLTRIVEAVGSFDLDRWLDVDGSSFMRFGPIYYFVITVNLSDPGLWFGHGAASSTIFFGKAFGYLAGADVLNLQLGFIPAFIYDYGLLAAGLFLTFAFLICRGPFFWQSFILILLMLFNANFNTQLFWFVLTSLLLSIPVEGRLYVKKECRD